MAMPRARTHPGKTSCISACSVEVIAIQASPLSTRVASAAAKLGTRMMTASVRGVQNAGGEQDSVRREGL